MRIDDTEASLRGYLATVGLRLEGAGAPAVLAAMMDRYDQERATDAAPMEEDGDMNLTRQLVRADDREGEGVIQLSMTEEATLSWEVAG